MVSCPYAVRGFQVFCRSPHHIALHAEKLGQLDGSWRRAAHADDDYCFMWLPWARVMLGLYGLHVCLHATNSFVAVMSRPFGSRESVGSGRQPVWATLSPRRARVAFVMPSALGLLPAACDDASALWHVLAVSAQSFSLYFIAAYRLLASRVT